MTERGSTRHGARVDDELKAESESIVRGSPVESRAESWRQMEPPAEGEPDPDAIPSRTEVERRSLLAASLRPSAFPGDRARLIAMAEAEHATDEVMAWLGRLPADVLFGNVQDVWDALGGMHERRAAPEQRDGERREAGIAAPPVRADRHDIARDHPGDHSIITIGRKVATEVGGVAVAAAAVVVGGALQSIRVVGRWVQRSSASR